MGVNLKILIRDFLLRVLRSVKEKKKPNKQKKDKPTCNCLRDVICRYWRTIKSGGEPKEREQNVPLCEHAVTSLWNLPDNWDAVVAGDLPLR